MADIALRDVGNSREIFVEIIYQEIGLEKEEVESIVKDIERGDTFVIYNIPSERIKSITEILKDNGNSIENIEDIRINKDVLVEKDFKFTDRTRKIYSPRFPSNVISRLDREETMSVLREVGSILKEDEKYREEIAELTSKLHEETSKANSIRKHVSGIARLISWIGIIYGAIIGTRMFPVIMTIVMAIIAAIIMNMTVKNYDRKIHRKENDAKAEEYALKNIYPLEARKNELTILRQEIFYGGKYDWALSVVGKEMMYSECIQDLYNLIESRRADNLKEALNKYDDKLHKQRIEEMQKATQDAVEISALEAIKQTEKMKRIERNTNDAVQTARVNAVLNYGTYENTRQINKKLRR